MNSDMNQITISSSCVTATTVVPFVHNDCYYREKAATFREFYSLNDFFIFIIPTTNISLLFDSFYRATRMHSADYAVARCLSVRQFVCPSVCHTPVLCVNGYTYPQSFFHHRVAPPFYFFLTKRDGNIPTRTPPP